MEPAALTIDVTGAGTVTGRLYRAGDAPSATLVLAHGAGAPQTHPFMVGAAEALAARGLAVVTFNFPYMEARRGLPDRAPVLERAWLDALAHISSRGDLPGAVFIGGKSMGGRIASHVAVEGHRQDLAVVPRGLVLLGYPLHPPGKPQQRRDAHLLGLLSPALFVQGTRDTFGTPDELAPVLASLGPRATLHVVEGGDHSFAVPRATGRKTQEVLSEVWDVVADWVKKRAA